MVQREAKKDQASELILLTRTLPFPRLPLQKLGTSLRQIAAVLAGEGGGEVQGKPLQRGSCQREGQAGVSQVPGVCGGVLWDMGAHAIATRCDQQ